MGSRRTLLGIRLQVAFLEISHIADQEAWTFERHCRRRNAVKLSGGQNYHRVGHLPTVLSANDDNVLYRDRREEAQGFKAQRPSENQMLGDGIGQLDRQLSLKSLVQVLAMSSELTAKIKESHEGKGFDVQILEAFPAARNQKQTHLTVLGLLILCRARFTHEPCNVSLLEIFRVFTAFRTLAGLSDWPIQSYSYSCSLMVRAQNFETKLIFNYGPLGP